MMCLPEKEWQPWLDKCKEEIDSLKKRKVFEVVDQPKDFNVVKNHWVFDIKSDLRKRARLVARGYSQVEGVDYDELFSPVVRYETVRILLALCALEDWELEALDVKTAFLYGELDEEIYMEQPEGFVKDSMKVWRLRRALYGLKQAGLSWWRACTKSMTQEFGFKRCASDAGVYVYNENGKTVIAIIYIDDALFIGNDKELVMHKKHEFM